MTRREEYKAYLKQLAKADTRIIGRVPLKIKERTIENEKIYNMGLADAFNEAARTYAKKGTELYKACYYGDYRKFIPSAYCPEYLDFSKYPIAYEGR